MRALKIQHDGGLRVEDVARPARPKGNDVLIRVKATTITKDELERLQTENNETRIPGRDVAGIIEAIGDKVTGFASGDEIFALKPPSHPGAAADYIILPSTDLAIKPPSLTFPEAASLPHAALTAYQALLTHAEAQSGQRIFITAAASGVGVMAVQIAAAEGLLVTALCSGEDEVKVLKSLGAHEVIDESSTRRSSLSSDYDIVLDTSGSEELAQYFALLKGKGTMICTVRPATVDEKAQRPDVEAVWFEMEPDGEELTRVAQCVEQEILRTVVRAVVPLEEGAKAGEMVRAGKGRVVVSLEGNEGLGRVDSPQEA